MEMTLVSIGVLGFFFYCILDQLWTNLRALGKPVPRWLQIVVLIIMILSIFLHLNILNWARLLAHLS